MRTHTQLQAEPARLIKKVLVLIGLILLNSQDCQNVDIGSRIMPAQAGHIIGYARLVPAQSKVVDFIFLEAIASAPRASETSIPFHLCSCDLTSPTFSLLHECLREEQGRQEALSSEDLKHNTPVVRKATRLTLN